jgi:DNA-binding IscR family transcriptional regulator
LKVDGHYHDLWEVIISIEEPLHLLSCCKSLEECHCGKSSKLEESWGDIINKWLEYYHNYTNGQGLK